MANSSSEHETDTLPERPTRIQPYQFEPVRQDFERVPEHRVNFEAKPHAVFHGVCEITLTEVLATQMGVMRGSKKVSSFELYKFNPLLPHCGSIARELVHSSANFYSSRQHSVTECICTLCLCCCMYSGCVALLVFFHMCTSVDLLRMCYVL